MVNKYLFLLLFNSHVLAMKLVKEKFCMDPDTGKMYAVDTTWSSTTFCGNYDCKVKKRSTDMDIQPTTQIETVKNINNTKDRDTEIDFQNEFKVSNKDRFLTESEIRTISELLKNVKKSDLDAVVEVYTVAQQIYKEIESSPEHIKNELRRHVLEKLRNNANKDTSYWHDVNKQNIDLDNAGTNQVYDTAYRYPNYRPYQYYYPRDYYQERARHPPYCPYHYYHYQPPPQPPSTTLMPYPYTQITRNFTSLSSHFDKPWPVGEKLNPESKFQFDKNLETAESEEDDDNPLLSVVDLKTDKKSNLAPWQTAELSKHLLSDVRANILESSEKLLKPLKKLNLERVAKVLRLDHLDRQKRNLNEETKRDGDSEIFIETTICELGTDPGVFSVGDQAKPYPECCPKKIL